MTDTTSGSTVDSTAVSATVDSYFLVWNETDAAQRRLAVAAVFTDDAEYVDPMAAVAGHDGMTHLVGAVQQQFPGHRFVRSGAVDLHHDRVRFGWDLVAPGGAVVASGTDVARLAADGRLATVTGFLEAPAAA
jgi:hypothetical protein